MLEGYTDTAAFGRFMEVLNNKIIQNIETQKIGISPQMVDLMFWCDKKCTNLLKDRDFEHQCGDHKSPWFKQVALFAELTNSAETGFNRKGFDAYFKHVQAQDYFFDANNILIKRQRNNILSCFRLPNRLAVRSAKICAAAWNAAGAAAMKSISKSKN